MKQLASLVVVLLILALQHPRPVDAQGNAKQLKAYRAAIAECVADVRRQELSPRFDMYLTQAGELRGWGSDHHFYLFNKCMEQRGYDVQVKRNR